MNLVDIRIEVHRDPIVQPNGRGAYQTRLLFYPGQTVAPLHLPACAIAVSDVLPGQHTG